MVPIRVIAGGPADDAAELWSGDERLGVIVIYEGRLYLRIDQRADGQAWLLDTTALSLALDEVTRQLDTN